MTDQNETEPITREQKLKELALAWQQFYTLNRAASELWAIDQGNQPAANAEEAAREWEGFMKLSRKARINFVKDNADRIDKLLEGGQKALTLLRTDGIVKRHVVDKALHDIRRMVEDDPPSAREIINALSKTIQDCQRHARE